MFRKIPEGWAVVLLGLALSACDSSHVPSPIASCEPGICVGSTPGSTPESIAEMMR
jgi:hypothetical protein